ncbi:hypothetical protein HYU13_03540 [Candidatus Woesearchaeota archaeon]|nr:hypothetical protein [Candidatus Woesearchaeota archaeon]
MIKQGFQDQVLVRLDHVERKVDHILSFLGDSKLTAEEKSLLQDSFANEDYGRLISGKKLKEKIGI